MKHHNKEYIAKSLIIAFIIFEFMYLIGSKEYMYYVHPRILIFLYISVVIFAFLLFANLRMLHQIRHIYNYKYCRIAVLPFLLMGGMSLFTRSNAKTEKKEELNMEATSEFHEPLNKRIENPKFELLDSEIYKFNRLLYDKKEILEDKIVTYTVFVHYNKDTANNQFMAARMTMVCCAADMLPDGLIVHMDKQPTWSEGTWIRLTGKIQYEYKKDIPLPFAYLTFISAEKTDKPISDVVYPEF